MRKLFLIVMYAFITSSVLGQVHQPATWKYNLSTKTPAIGDELEVIFNVNLEMGWYLYSSDFDRNLGPMVTTFTFEPNNTYELIGEIIPVGSKKKYDEIWGGEYTYFRNKAQFKQKVSVKQLPVQISGSYSYQVCTEDKCIPFDDEFSLKSEEQKVNEIKAEITENELEPKTKVEEVEITEKVEVLESNNSKQEKSLWGFFLLSFLAGLAAILTPCVFPMIPMTVSFFMNSSDNKAKAKLQASVYGFSIIAIYTIIGTVVAVTLGANFANFLSTHWIPNVFFFLIFLIFAASFFGMFEITLPSWMVNRTDKQADKGGFTGAFFMAFTLVLVSFSCTGPIVGAILVASASGEVLEPIIGMLGFSAAFALPFTFFALFPSLLSNLPKSGGWLNSVKVVLGFIELALGLKFLSIADQTYHWGILDREVYLALWIVIFVLMGFYLLGKLRFSHDSELKHVSVPRLILAILSFGFVVYLVPGMFGAPLKALSGYLPPQTSLDFDLPAMIKESKGKIKEESTLHDENEIKYSNILHLPHGIKGYYDFEQGMEAARKQNKPVFVDFTGHGCVNCREMEANVWSDPKVLKRLKEDYIVIALYVDDKTKLPEQQWYTSDYDKKVKKTIGKQNADFQIKRFNVNAQPYYVLMDHKEDLLVEPKAYDLNIDSFVQFLDKGIDNYKADS